MAVASRRLLHFGFNDEDAVITSDWTLDGSHGISFEGVTNGNIAHTIEGLIGVLEITAGNPKWVDWMICVDEDGKYPILGGKGKDLIFGTDSGIASFSVEIGIPIKVSTPNESGTSDLYVFIKLEPSGTGVLKYSQVSLGE